MKRVLIAPNAFKGCLTADDAARALSRGVHRACPDTAVDLMPISDGGDGLMEVLLRHLGGKKISKIVMGPLGGTRKAEYAVLKNGSAVIEMARASGIAGLKRSQLDPLGATSYGTGELIRDAFSRGVRRVIVGMGGSATNDGGAGMAEALGARFLGKRGRFLPRGAGSLRDLDRVDLSGFSIPRGAEVTAVSDVRNPLLGPRGSARVYGPQKGATPAQVRILESALARYAKVLARDAGLDVAPIPGSGAAGGLGAGLLAFLKARLVPGADWVLDMLDADRRMRGVGLVLTGEGCLDTQSFFGKGPVTLARRAERKRIPVAFICGRVDPEAVARLRPGERVYALSGEQEGIPALRLVRQRLVAAAERAVRDAGWAVLLAVVLSAPVLALPGDRAAQGPSGPGYAAAAASVATTASSGDSGSNEDQPVFNPTGQEIVKADHLYLHRDVPGNLDRSLEILNGLDDKNPKNAQILWRIGRDTLRAGEGKSAKSGRLAQFQKAEDVLKRSIDLDPKIADAHFWLGLAYGRRGQTQGIMHSLFLVKPIRQEMNRTLELDPNFAGAHHVLGEMLREIPGFAGGSKKGAVEEMEQAVALQPSETSVYSDLAQAYLDLGEKDKAIATLKKIYDVKQPADPADYPDDLKAAAALLKKLGAQ